MKTASQKQDEKYLPSHYEAVEQPYYKGDGVHSVNELQQLCNQFSEYCHQQQIIKQELLKLTSQSRQPDVRDSLPVIEFIEELERMQGLYRNQRYTQAESTRDELAKRLDDLMRQ